MRVNHGQAVLALIGVTGFIAGCGGSSSSSSVAHIRTLNDTTNGDAVTVIVNTASVISNQPLNGPAPPYLFINTGTSTFSYISYVNSNSSTSTLPSSANPYNTTAQINSGVYYTAYATGRPDLVTPITSPIPYGAMQTVVYPDTHSLPSAGNVNLRFFNGAPDANTSTNLGAVDFYLDNGAKPIITDVPFAGISGFATTVPSGTHQIEAYQAGSKTNLVFATTTALTFTSQRTETIEFQEPTATFSPNVYTFQFTQIEDF